jgi:hypothetical protein
MTSVLAVLGKMINSDEMTDFSEQFAPIEVSDDPPHRQYRGSAANGIDLLLENGCVIAIQIYSQSTEEFSPFMGDFPFNIQKGMTQKDIHLLLGTPAQSDSYDSKYLMKEIYLKLIVIYDTLSTIKRLNIEALK